MIVKPTLEIIISTMNRSDLSFLRGMFPDMDLSSYSILIINQTKLNQDLVSITEGIRVINSREFGLSKSRNLAIENAIGDILVVADDDIEYLPGFDKTILQAYKDYDQASLISFQFLNDNKEFAKFYPKKEGYLSSKRHYLTSFEMTFKKSDILKNQIYFNEYFGLGARFVCAEEQVLRNDIQNKNLKAVYKAKAICIHPGKTSGFNQGTPGFIRAITAQKYLVYKNWTYLWLLKYVLFLYRYEYISFFEQPKAYQIGVKAINEIKTLEHEG
jgi:glycosyltransferase involved in cell wall biosynthesis